MRHTLAMAAVTVALFAMPVQAQVSGHAGHEGHEGHGMSGMDAQKAESDQPADAPAQEPEAMPGMDHSTHTMDHSGHAMDMPTEKPVPQLAPPPAAFSGPAHAADVYYPDGTMAHVRTMMAEEMGGLRTTMVMLDRLEIQSGKGGDGWAWEGGVRSGGDIDRLWIKSEGEGELSGGIDDADVEALWGHAIGPWFDLQAGVRQQFLRGPERTQLVLGVEGHAPYKFDISAEAFVSTKGELTARIEVDIDQRLTQRLVLQPRAEVELSAQDMPGIGIGDGVTSLEAGLRLRYEIRREFAPYVGVEWQKQFGQTARYAQADGESADRVVGLIGVRAWF